MISYRFIYIMFSEIGEKKALKPKMWHEIGEEDNEMPVIRYA